MAQLISTINTQVHQTFANIFFNIHQLMIEQQAVYFQSTEGRIYQTILHNSYSNTLLQWRFEPNINNSVKVRIRPNISDSLGNNFRVNSQRNLVDLLRILSNFNRDKNMNVKFVVSEYHDIEICTVYPESLLKNKNIIRKAIKSTLRQIKPTFQRLIGMLKPFLDPQYTPVEGTQTSYAAKDFLDKSYKLLLLTKFNQLKYQYQLQTVDANCQSQDQEKQLQKQRLSALQKMKDCLKMLGIPQTFLNNPVTCFLPSYVNWINHNSKEGVIESRKVKNVYSVKILAEKNLPLEKTLQGSHCSLQVGFFKMVITFSMNEQVNKAVKQYTKSKEATKQVQLQLVKKIIKNQKALQSKNSFQNQKDFIVYIKERSCKFISTYYWDCEKKNEERPIIMDYYPFNLKEMILSQAQSLGSKEKLSIILKIVTAIDWLASNFVCHRDIKPENIMMSENRIPKLVDFGSCCPTYGVAQHFKVKETRLLATPGYFHRYTSNMSKLYQRQQYQQHLLFDAYSIGQIIMDIFNDGFPNLLPSLQVLIRYIVQKCREENPADRLTYRQMQYLFRNFVKCIQLLEEQENAQPVSLQELKGPVFI